MPRSMPYSLIQKLTGELLGTALLLAVVIGSGMMGQRLASGNDAIALLANTAATVAGLYVLIEVFGPISGAHFNPAVSTIMTIRGTLAKKHLLPYIVAQLTGALFGAWLAHVMFDISVLQVSSKIRTGTGQWIAEIVATAGLLLVILRAPSEKSPPWSPPISVVLTGSPLQPHLPILQQHLGECLATPLLVFRPRAFQHLLQHNSQVRVLD